VKTALSSSYNLSLDVESALNYEVNRPYDHANPHPSVVEEVLNCKVNTTLISCSEMTLMVEAALNKNK
jgi:hypothetical protein